MQFLIVRVSVDELTPTLTELRERWDSTRPSEQHNDNERELGTLRYVESLTC